MSVAICRSPAVLPFLLEKEGIGIMMMPTTTRSRDSQVPSIPSNTSRLAPAEPAVEETNIEDKELPAQSDIWTMIQSQKATCPAATDTPPAPYVHPLMRRSSSLMSQKSLEMCTESLGSETGSEDFSSLFSDDDEPSEEEMEEIEERSVKQSAVRAVTNGRKELSSVNYHCSSRSQQPRSFPPPLPSISRRDGPCVQMRPHRRDGRLVMEAVPVPSQNYLHARRQDGRLLLTFIDAAVRQPCSDIEKAADVIGLPTKKQDLKQEEEQVLEGGEPEQKVCDDDEDDDEEEDEEEEEEVEVVDRGTVVEVTVSTPPQQLTGAARVHRSSLVINKFVGGAPLTNQNRWAPPPQQEKVGGKEKNSNRPLSPPQRRAATTTTTAAAAVAVAASSASSLEPVGERAGSTENKLLFTSKRRNREEMLHHMRRCSELRAPLFFWEPCCIATS